MSHKTIYTVSKKPVIMPKKQSYGHKMCRINIKMIWIVANFDEILLTLILHVSQLLL